MRSLLSAILDRWRFAPADPVRLAALGIAPFAHRGLHGGGRVENSLAAFDAAIARGHGIELDVQQSRDGEAMVFHDATLDRLSGETGRVADRSAAELSRIGLSGAPETIPTLPVVLAHIGGRVPLLIEIKAPDRHVAGLCAAVARALDTYSGPVAVMSFNPEAASWFARARPGVIRGLVVSEEADSRAARLRKRVELAGALFRARPQFLAYDIASLPSPTARAARAAGLPLFTWTVRTAEQRARAAHEADQPVYEDQ
jgi:glycerophosphoryl diester phosphodiesterase